NEMAMIVARFMTYVYLFEDNVGNHKYRLTTNADFNTLKVLVDYFQEQMPESLASADEAIEGQRQRVNGLDTRVTKLESLARSIDWTGALRVRVEDFITGQPDDTSAQVEQQLYLYADATPSDYLAVSTGVYVTQSDLNADDPGTGFFDFGGSAPLIDHMTADADLVQLLGYDDGIDSWLNRAHVIVGRQYAQFGTYGMTFDNNYESRPGFTLDAGGDHWEGKLFLARDINSVSSEQEGLGVMRLGYGWGSPVGEDTERTDRARIGINYLWTGVGAENGLGADVDAQLGAGPWFANVRAEYLHMNEDQAGAPIEDTYSGGLEHSLIAGTDIYNDGQLVVNGRYASIGLPPGYSSIDNDPFSEYDYDTVSPGGNLAINGDFGLNYFPADFEGFGIGVEYTWFEKYYMQLRAWDGTRKSDGAEVPATIRLLGRYPLSEESSLAIEYIHQGIDAPTTAKLRGEFFVEF
ncbi:MAG: hypothetical protein ABI743_08990, partial [bacterium]